MNEAVDVAELYRGPPEGFVAARQALVKALRAEKRRDEAAAVNALARPSVAAWAANHVTRADPGAVPALVEAGAALLAAQRNAIEVGDASAIRDAQADRRRQVRTLADAAVEFLTADGRNGEGQRAELVAIFEAVSVDPTAAAELAAGQLARRPEATSGFDLLGAGLQIVTAPRSAPPVPAAAPARPAPPTRAAQHPTTPADAGPAALDAKAAEQAEKSEQAARAERKAAIDAAQRALVDAEVELNRAKDEVAAANAAAGAVDTELAAARETVTELERQLREATERAASLEVAADQARQRLGAATRASAEAAQRRETAQARLDKFDGDQPTE